MSRNNILTLRFTDAEMKLIEKQASLLKKQKSQYIRDCALGANKAQPAVAPGIELGNVNAQFEQLREDISEMKSTISDLFRLIKESRRIPSFREYRARAYAAGNEKLQNESAYDYIMRLARDYWANYGVWPRWVERDFGSAIPGYDMAKWPDKFVG